MPARIALLLLVVVVATPAAAQPGRVQFGQPLQGPDGAGVSMNSTFQPAPTYPYGQPPVASGVFAGPPAGGTYQQGGGYGTGGYPGGAGSQPYAPMQPFSGFDPVPSQQTQFQQPYYDQLGSGYIPRDQVLVYRPDRLREVDFSYSFIPALSQGQLSVQEIDLSATLQFNPFRLASPLTLRPGGRMTLWGGPENPPLGPRTYDLFLGVGWQPQITDRFLLDLEAQPTVSTDFKRTSGSLRILGRVMGIYAWSDNLDIAAGAVYLDRDSVGVLPVGGVVYRPSDRLEMQLLFPRPKVRYRVEPFPYFQAETWVYLAGEYGGGHWSVELDNGVDDRFDYNDIRFFGGAEIITPLRSRAFVETHGGTLWPGFACRWSGCYCWLPCG